MEVDIIMLMGQGLVLNQFVIIDEITAEAQFDKLCEGLIGDDYFEELQTIDYGETLSHVNTFLEGTGTEIIWLNRVEVNEYVNDDGE